MPQRVEFKNSEGQTLSGRLDLPAGRVRAGALFAHCFSCSKDFVAARSIARRLTQHGIGVLRFDFTGLGESAGDFADTNFSSNLDDLVAAADWLREQHGPPALLIGHSLGGAAVVAASSRIPDAMAVATIGAPADAEHVIHNFGDRLDEIETRGLADVSLAGRPFTIKKQFVDDVRGARVRDAAATLRKPLLVLHAPTDEVVGIDNATGLFIAAKHPKSFVSLDTADHLLTRPADAEFAADVISGWAGRYIGSAKADSAAGSPADRAVHVKETGAGKFENAIAMGPFDLIADEPKSFGGDDNGPNPYDLLTASLGACTSMTLRMYADRKGLPLDRVRVRLTHAKDHADDCEHCEEGRKVDVFEKEITLEGDLTDAQRQRLLEIADRCPVHRTLHEPVVVRTKLV